LYRIVLSHAVDMFTLQNVVQGMHTILTHADRSGAPATLVALTTQSLLIVEHQQVISVVRLWLQTQQYFSL